MRNIVILATICLILGEVLILFTPIMVKYYLIFAFITFPLILVVSSAIQNKFIVNLKLRCLVIALFFIYHIAFYFVGISWIAGKQYNLSFILIAMLFEGFSSLIILIFYSILYQKVNKYFFITSFIAGFISIGLEWLIFNRIALFISLKPLNGPFVYNYFFWQLNLSIVINLYINYVSKLNISCPFSKKVLVS